jgi:AhpD family alkylhydroperoxidase
VPDDHVLPDLTGRPASAGPPRFRAPAFEELDGDQAAVHRAIADGPRRSQTRVPLTDDEGRLRGPFGPMLLTPRIGGAVQQVGAALRTDPDLPPRMRELAILAVGAAAGSRFEWDAHEPAALAAGATAEQLQAVLDGAEPPGLDEREALAVATVRRLRADGTLDDERYAEAVAVLGEATLAALVWLTGYYAMLAIALGTFRPEGT